MTQNRRRRDREAQLLPTAASAIYIAARLANWHAHYEPMCRLTTTTIATLLALGWPHPALVLLILLTLLYPIFGVKEDIEQMRADGRSLEDVITALRAHYHSSENKSQAIKQALKRAGYSRESWPNPLTAAPPTPTAAPPTPTAAPPAQARASSSAPLEAATPTAAPPAQARASSSAPPEAATTPTPPEHPASSSAPMGVEPPHPPATSPADDTHPGYDGNVLFGGAPLAMPPDGLCFYHSLLCGARPTYYHDTPQILPSGHFTGERAKELTTNAKVFRAAIIARLLEAGLEQEAARLGLSGADGYPDEEDFSYAAEEAGYAFEVIDAAAPAMQPRRYGEGKVRVVLELQQNHFIVARVYDGTTIPVATPDN